LPQKCRFPFRDYLLYHLPVQSGQFGVIFVVLDRTIGARHRPHVPHTKSSVANCANIPTICCVIIPCIQNLFTYQLAEVFLGRGVWKVFLGRDVWKGAFAHDLITRDQVMIS
jgi:hypothetical protein